jgi:mRNA interferase YafQ
MDEMDIRRSTQFKRDVKLAKKRGFDIDKLTETLHMLARRETLPESYRNHRLFGEYADFWECHVNPDFLLIYRIEDNELILYAYRAGTHSDLFKK